MILETSPARPRDALLLDIREEDAMEIDLHGWPAREAALLNTMDRTDGAMRVRGPCGTLLALYGHTTTRIGVHPWLISAEGIRDYPLDVLRLARGFIRGLCATYPDALLCNWVSKQAARNRSFITNLGFIIEEREGAFDFFYLPQNNVP